MCVLGNEKFKSVLCGMDDLGIMWGLVGEFESPLERRDDIENGDVLILLFIKESVLYWSDWPYESVNPVELFNWPVVWESCDVNRSFKLWPIIDVLSL